MQAVHFPKLNLYVFSFQLQPGISSDFVSLCALFEKPLLFLKESRPLSSTYVLVLSVNECDDMSTAAKACAEVIQTRFIPKEREPRVVVGSQSFYVVPATCVRSE
jgi:hypothetical protein